MKISKIFNLGKTQSELDFVDIDVTKDTRLFIDPAFLSKRIDNWSIEANLTIKSFFQQVLDLIRKGKIDDARELFAYLGEPNSTCLGMSKGKPKGKGVGEFGADKIFDSLLASKAVETGIVSDIEDSILFIDDFGKDKLSDMVTNIIRLELIIYTQNQCELHGIRLTPGMQTGYYWNKQTLEWDNSHSDMLIVSGKNILLVPKAIVTFCRDYVPGKYYQHYVLHFLQNEHLKMGSSLIQKRKSGDLYVTKESLKKIAPNSKDFLRNFTTKHKDVLANLKDSVNIKSLTNEQISKANLKDVCIELINKLISTKSGNDEASSFHKIIHGIMELLFYPHLINPVKEREIDEGRKRIDICFDNAAQEGIFYALPTKFNLFCPYIFIECKNYSKDVANPEIDQIAGRFSVHRGRVGFIICRDIQDMKLFIKRCKDTYVAGRGLVIPLIDDDLIYLLSNYKEDSFELFDQLLSDKIRDITL